MQINEHCGNTEVEQNGQDHPGDKIKIDRLEDLASFVSCSFVLAFVDGVSNQVSRIWRDQHDHNLNQKCLINS